MSTIDVVRPLVLMQVILTLFLIALLRIYYARLGRQEFLLWWARAWTAYGIYLAAEWAWVELSMLWTPRVVWLLVLSTVAGLLEAALVAIGASSLQHGSPPRPRTRRVTIGLLMGAGVAGFLLSVLLVNEQVRYGARAIPRHVLLGAAYLYCASALLRHWRRVGAEGARTTAAACAVQGAFSLWFAAYLAHNQGPPTGALTWLLALMKGACQLGITLGVVRLVLGEAESAGNRLRTLVQGLRVIVWEADAETFRFTFVSDHAEEILGYPVAQWLREAAFWVNLIHPDDRERSVELRRQATAQGRDHDFEYRARAADGRVVWLRDVVRAAPDGTGRVRRLRGAMVDITERKQSEQERQRLASLVENSTECISVASLEGQMLYLNPAGLRLFGLDSLEAARTKSVEDFFDESDKARVRDKIMPDLARSGRWEGELSLRHFGTGRPIPLLINAFAVKDQETGQTIALSSVSHDITERKRLEEQLRQAQKMNAVGRLAGGVAHDFNNLLTVILGYCDLALHEAPPGDPLRDSVMEVRKAGERAAALTQQLLAFSRQQVLQPAALCLNAVIAEVERLLERLIGEHIAVTIVKDPALGLIQADPGQIQQVLMNLAINARDAMPEGGRLTIETANQEVGAEPAGSRAGPPPGRYVVLTVSDTGHGMDEQTQARVFEPFFTTKGPGSGTGLGLSTVYGIVEQSGGQIQLESARGQGTLFRIYLPRLEKPAEAAAAVAAVRGSLNGSETILLVEDDEAVRPLLRTILLASGYTVIEASNGEAAIQLSAAHRGLLHLLVTDMVMPQVGGRGLAEHLLAARPGIKVLYMSGYTGDDGIHPAGRHPGTAFLQKPFTAEEMRRTIRELLDSPSEGPLRA